MSSRRRSAESISRRGPSLALVRRLLPAREHRRAAPSSPAPAGVRARATHRAGDDRRRNPKLGRTGGAGEEQAGSRSPARGAVLTAHPTEATRRSVLAAHQRIAERLRSWTTSCCTAAQRRVEGPRRRSRPVADGRVRRTRPARRRRDPHGLWFFETSRRPPRVAALARRAAPGSADGVSVRHLDRGRSGRQSGAGARHRARGRRPGADAGARPLPRRHPRAGTGLGNVDHRDRDCPRARGRRPTSCTGPSSPRSGRRLGEDSGTATAPPSPRIWALLVTARCVNERSAPSPTALCDLRARVDVFGPSGSRRWISARTFERRAPLEPPHRRPPGDGTTAAALRDVGREPPDHLHDRVRGRRRRRGAARHARGCRARLRAPPRDDRRPRRCRRPRRGAARRKGRAPRSR